MLGLQRLSIQSKLMLMLLAVATLSIATVGWIAYANGRDVMTATAFRELTNVRSAKKLQIEALFKNIRNETANLADDRMIVEAMREMGASFNKLKSASIKPEWDDKLREFYSAGYLPRLAKATGQNPRLDAFLPKPPEARYVQYWYLAANPNQPSDRYKTVNAGDGSEYSAVHERYQSILTKLILDFGYDNMALVDQRTGDVVYTFGKSQLFGTNLNDGPYWRTDAGDMFRALAKSQNINEVLVSDFSFAPYATGRPVAMMGAPIIDGSEVIGVLFLQFPLDEINRVMTDGFGWQAAGMGNTGESYLVGSDGFMRSTARALYENPEKFYQGMQKAGYSSEDMDRVRRSGLATLSLPIRSKFMEEALSGKAGTTIDTHYVGNPAVFSYAPLEIPGLRWVVVSEVSVDEAFEALNHLNRSILISAMFLVLGVTVVAAILGRKFVQPIFRLVEGAKRLQQGETNVSVEVKSRDEFADLGHFFNGMSSDITQIKELADRRTAEREFLISNVLPEAAAGLMKHGEDQVPTRFEQVSILYADFTLQTEPDGSAAERKSYVLLHDLLIALDDAAELRGVEKLSGNGANYIAVCGMSRQRLDQATRILDFAQDILKAVRRLNRDRQTDLSARIGVVSGPATGGVLGRIRIAYHLAGNTMSCCKALASEAPRNGVLVTRDIYDATSELYSFGERMEVPLPGGQRMPVFQVAFDAAADPSVRGTRGGLD